MRVSQPQKEKTTGRQRFSITQKENHQCEIGKGNISKTDEAGSSAGISDLALMLEKHLMKH